MNGQPPQNPWRGLYASNNTANKPSANVPSMNIPSTSMPILNMPIINIPSINVPRTNTPSINISSINIPSTNMSSIPTNFGGHGIAGGEKNAVVVPACRSEFDVVNKQGLERFVRQIDPTAQLDEQATHLVSTLADAFVKDVTMRVVKLAKYRKDQPRLLDVEFTLRREYNLRFPDPFSK